MKHEILLIHSNNIFAQQGASANRWRTMIEGLANNGIDIQIVITEGFGTVKEFQDFGWKGTFKDKPISYIYTIFLLHNSLWMRRISYYLLSPLLRKINIARVRNLISKSKPSIIWLEPSLQTFDIYLNIFRETTNPDFKLMIELNEFHDIGLVHATNKLQSELSKRYSKILLTEILPRTDLLLIMTRHLLDYYRQFSEPGRASYMHLPMTVNMQRFYIERRPTERYIAYCGSSSFIKDGVDILIQSFSLIQSKYPNIKMKIAAFMEADGVKMIELIKNLNLNSSVEYVGELSSDEVPAFIMNAELLLLPRPDSRQAQGGFPTKLGEYLATGNPVCATTVGEIPDYLTDNENVFFAEPGNVKSFASAMDRALSNPLNSRKVGENGLKVAKDFFDMEVQSKKLIRFLQENKV